METGTRMTDDSLVYALSVLINTPTENVLSDAEKHSVQNTIYLLCDEIQKRAVTG